jgi:hypothetical protein
MPERRYDDKEVGPIFQRATETSAAAQGEGLTLEQLEVIAAEAGMATWGTGLRRCDEPNP